MSYWPIQMLRNARRLLLPCSLSFSFAFLSIDVFAESIREHMSFKKFVRVLGKPLFRESAVISIASLIATNWRLTSSRVDSLWPPRISAPSTWACAFLMFACNFSSSLEALDRLLYYRLFLILRVWSWTEMECLLVGGRIVDSSIVLCTSYMESIARSSPSWWVSYLFKSGRYIHFFVF